MFCQNLLNDPFGDANSGKVNGGRFGISTFSLPQTSHWEAHMGDDDGMGLNFKKIAPSQKVLFCRIRTRTTGAGCPCPAGGSLAPRGTKIGTPSSHIEHTGLRFLERKYLNIL